MIPDEVLAAWQRRLPRLEAELAEDTNHYTVMLGARGSEVSARAATAGR